MRSVRSCSDASWGLRTDPGLCHVQYPATLSADRIRRHIIQCRVTLHGRLDQMPTAYIDTVCLILQFIAEILVDAHILAVKSTQRDLRSRYSGYFAGK